MNNDISRRGFLKTAGLGIAAVIGTKSVFGADANKPADTNKPEDANAAGAQLKYMEVPRRKLGKTGLEVSILNMGGIFETGENQIVLRRAVDWGVTFWDTAHGYLNGNSETGMGEFIAKNPDLRKKLVIVTKGSGKPDELEKQLQTSLKRLQTKYIDILYYHGVSKPEQLNDELKAFAKSAKDRGLIKFYGFSTHSNMAACMAAAAKTDWIDVIMAKYSFREMGDSAVNDAVGACHKAGIGLVAMKTQAKGPESDAEKKLLTHFLQKGYTPEQAKVKAVWQDERISSICSQMPNVAILVSNVAAALDKTKLVQADFDILNQYAAVCGGYCAGCSEICSGEVPVGDLMRIAMYHNSYGNTQQAREELARMDSGLLSRMAQYDFGNAESRCPQRLQIGRIVRETLTKLA